MGGRTGYPSGFFHHLFWKRTFEDKWQGFYKKPDVKRLKETQSTDQTTKTTNWLASLLSSFAIRLMMEGWCPCQNPSPIPVTNLS